MPHQPQIAKPAADGHPPALRLADAPAVFAARGVHALKSAHRCTARDLLATVLAA
jgi:hypothetical protein